MLEGRDRQARNEIIAIRDEAEVFGGAGRLDTWGEKVGDCGQLQRNTGEPRRTSPHEY